MTTANFINYAILLLFIFNSSVASAFIPLLPFQNLLIPKLRTYRDTISPLLKKYNTSLIESISNENYNVLLIGTLHVSNHSVQMVEEIISAVKPGYIVLELCNNRVDCLLPSLMNK